MRELKEESRRKAEARVARVKKACGGESEMKQVADAAVHKHERHDHPGKKLTHLMNGGAAKKRLDRAPRKSGGRTKGKTTVNVIVDTNRQGNQPPMAPAAPMMPPPAAMAPARPPMAPPMGAPMGLPPAMPAVPGAGMRKKGGKVEYTGGALSGIGRLEKAANYGARK